MADVITRERALEFAALDISAQPHPEGVYLQLFQRARKLRRAIKIISHEYGEISTINVHKRDGVVESFSGSIYRSTKIDENADWFDADTGETATDEAKEGLSIPGNLRANTKIIYWHFTLEPHVLVFLRKNGDATLSPNQAAAFFARLLNMAAEKMEGVEYVDVTTIKSKEQTERIFKKPVVRSLVIDLKRPNPDGPNGAWNDILKQMEIDGAARWQETLTAPEGGTLKNSARVEKLVEATQRLGSAKAVTYDEEGLREVINTENHPHTEKHVYDPASNVPLIQFVAAIAVGIVVDIVRKLK